MNCPLCHQLLDRATLLSTQDGTPELSGYSCPEGHGVFLPADFYFAWHDNRTPKTTLDLAQVSDDVGDVKRAKLCPQDGRIMTRYRVGGEGSFWLDRCGTCGGAWFDGSEWDVSVAAGLHEALPRVFTEEWQREFEDEAHARARRERLRRTLGTVDLERVEAFRAWAWAHPQRHLLLARLNERPSTPPAQTPEPDVPSASE